jgi:hypothetical protein
MALLVTSLREGIIETTSASFRGLSDLLSVMLWRGLSRKFRAPLAVPKGPNRTQGKRFML